MGLGNIGLPGLLLIAVVVLVLFGRGKISGLMGEVGKGITAFKKGVNDGTKELDEEIAEAHWFDIDNMPNVPPGSAISRWLIDEFVNEVKASR